MPPTDRRHQDREPAAPRFVTPEPGSVRFPLDDERPWGGFSVLADEADHKVKRIVVLPGRRMSLQRHRRRSEHWHVVAGDAIATRDGDELDLGPGDSLDIPRGAAHRIAAVGPGALIFIEVQRGEYFGEDDIERLEDDFGRC
jgi:mannose-6-phosphate isomerase